MYKKLTEKERLRNLASENARLSQRNAELEEALLELAQYVAKQEVTDGKDISEEN